MDRDIGYSRYEIDAMLKDDPLMMFCAECDYPSEDLNDQDHCPECQEAIDKTFKYFGSVESMAPWKCDDGECEFCDHVEICEKEKI